MRTTEDHTHMNHSAVIVRIHPAGRTCELVPVTLIAGNWTPWA